MQTVLKNLHVTPGIIGGVIADAYGTLLAHSFPPLFVVADLQSVCTDVSNSLAGLQEATGGVKLLDLRFDHGRVIARQMPRNFLLLLCEQNVSLPLLQISINVAVKNLEAIPADISARQIPVTAAVPAPQPEKMETPGVRLTNIVELSMSSGMI